MAVDAYKPYTPGFVPTNITTGKLGYETNPFDYPFTGKPNGQAAADGVVGPNAIYEFMRQIWTPEVLEHKFNQNLLISAFNAPVEDGWMNNLSRSHSARITFKKWMNPLQRVRVAELKYLEDKTCRNSSTLTVRFLAVVRLMSMSRLMSTSALSIASVLTSA